MGDVDGDGDLDLVFGNYVLLPHDYCNTLYENTGGTFASAPIWSSEPTNNETSSVALGDVDGDGDLDAVVANNKVAQDMYLNDGNGAFSAHPISPAFGAGGSRTIQIFQMG